MTTRFTEENADAEVRAHILILQGQKLTDAQAPEMESELAAQPDNLDLRAQLLGYYGKRQYDKNADNTARNAHILWLIANRPDAPIAGLPCAQIDLPLNADAYAQAKNLWLEQAARHPEKVAVLNNAAHFFTQSDRDIADELFGKAQALEPEEHFHATLLQHAAKMALAAQNFDEAKNYADELLAYGLRQPRKEAGDAIHHSNLVLGELALRFNRRDEAKARLLAAGDAASSPVLSSFGPRMTLAKALLEAGEKETVLQYFDLCAKFWNRAEL